VVALRSVERYGEVACRGKLEYKNKGTKPQVGDAGTGRVSTCGPQNLIYTAGVLPLLTSTKAPWRISKRFISIKGAIQPYPDFNGLHRQRSTHTVAAIAIEQ